MVCAVGVLTPEEAMIAEADIIPDHFISKVDDLKVAPIDYSVYEESQKGIMRLIYKTRRKLKAAKSPMLKLDLKDKIARLMVIEKDLQKALEL
jgi:hypothetical protein